MAGWIVEIGKAAKTLAPRQAAPSLHTFSKALFCTVSSTGEKKSDTDSGKGKDGEHKDDADGGVYGQPQQKPGEAAQSAHSHWEKSGSSSAHEESLADTGFDMSKRSKPSGDE